MPISLNVFPNSDLIRPAETSRKFFIPPIVPAPSIDISLAFAFNTVLSFSNSFIVRPTLARSSFNPVMPRELAIDASPNAPKSLNNSSNNAACFFLSSAVRFMFSASIFAAYPNTANNAPIAIANKPIGPPSIATFSPVAAS